MNQSIRFDDLGTRFGNARSPESSVWRRTAFPALLLLLWWVFPAELHAQTKTASVNGNCRSLSFQDDIPGIGPGFTVLLSLTTYDGQSGWPLGLMGLADQGFNNSGELRPRAGQPGVYEADFVNFFQGVVSYGSLTVTLPTLDADQNGLPDVVQKDKDVNASFTGSGATDYDRSNPTASFQIINGWMSRSANSESGNISFTSQAAGTAISFSGTYRLDTTSGTATYSRGTPNTITLDLVIHPQGQNVSVSGSTTFTVVSTDQIQLPEFALTSPGLGSIVVKPMTLNRTGRKYVGNMELADGDPTTAWPDYTQWILEIGDANDTNGNGIPDLTDADSPPPPPNLVPYQPEGWADKLLVTLSPGSTRDSSLRYDDQDLYVGWAVLNDSISANIVDRFWCRLYLDNQVSHDWFSDGLEASYYTYLTDFPLGRLSAGSHTPSPRSRCHWSYQRVRRERQFLH